MSISTIVKKHIASDMEQFDTFFREEIKSQAYLLNLIAKYILKTKGKQLRPMLVFLSAKLNGEINQSTYSAAFMIELMHTATLVHDDVVDDSLQRRGWFSINALWKNKIAVLVGDFFLAKGLLHAVKHKEFDLLEIVSDAVKEMSEGELLQIEKSRLLDITEEVYFEIIKKKTATLLSAAMMAGAKSVKADDASLLRMKEIGNFIGLAFQIKDDIFDYEQSNIIGKPYGNDIKEQKLTLPLIYALNHSSNSEKKWIMSIIKKHNTNAKKVKELVDYVKAKGGIQYAISRMNELKQQAIAKLSEYPESDIRSSFEALLHYITDREK